MKLVKLFETPEMPDELCDVVADIFESELNRDLAMTYVVGYIFDDCGDSGAQELDQWLIKQGAEKGEQVLIYHGKFVERPQL